MRFRLAELDSILEFLDPSTKLLLRAQLPRAHIALNDIGLAPPEIIFANPVLKPHDVPSFILAEVIKNHDSQEFSPTAESVFSLSYYSKQGRAESLTVWSSP